MKEKTVKITKKTIKNIIFEDKRYFIKDLEIKGFAIRVYPSGKSSYVITYKDKTENKRNKIITISDTSHLSPDQAREEAKKILGDIAKGDNPIEKRRKEKRDALTFGDFFEKEYRQWVLTNLKAGQETVNKINRHFIPVLKNKKIKEITSWDIDKWRSKKIKEGVKTSSINREITALKGCLSRAVEWGKIDKNPLSAASGFKLKKVDSRPNIRFLSDDEENRLRQALDAGEERIRAKRDSFNLWRAERGYKLLTDLRTVEFADHLKPLVLLSLNTGARRGELFNLTWNDIDFERKIMTIQGTGTKSGKTLHIPLNKEALDTLQQWKKQSKGSGLVFPGKDGEKMNHCNTSWRAILKEAGIENFRWHDMRHNFASKLVMSGVDLTTVRELLGHADFTMTLRYSHLGDHIKRQAVEKLVTARN